MSDIVLIKEEKALQCFKTNTLQTLLDAIKENVENFVGDPSTPTGRKEIRSKVATVRTAKVTIDLVGKNLNDERNRLNKLVNADRNMSKDFLDKVINKKLEKVLEYEKIEKDKVEKARELAALELDFEEAIELNVLFDREKAVAQKEAEIEAEKERLRKIEQDKIDEQNRLDYEAKVAKEAKEEADRLAAEQVEIAKQAAINAENERLAAIEKAKQDKIDAENKRVEDAKQAEIDKQNAIEKAVEAERKQKEIEAAKQAVIEKIKKEAEAKKAANLNHRKKIHREILLDLQAGLAEHNVSDNALRELILKASSKKIRHLQINY